MFIIFLQEILSSNLSLELIITYCKNILDRQADLILLFKVISSFSSLVFVTFLYNKWKIKNKKNKEA